ncbi:MAG: SIS domain-containing protein [Psychrobium sp.]|nr:SIS domain-containing protein [Psychrobium sp.]
MTQTIMEQEALQTAVVIKQQLINNVEIVRNLGKELRSRAPSMVMIIGRGSSDHAGVFAKYLIEIEAGVPVCAAAPSVVSVYGKTLKLKHALVLIISQSGRSPDILAQAEMAKASGAFTVALVNDETSPLAQLVDVVLPLGAGEELSVAATKSYLSTLSALLQMTAYWTQNDELIAALDTLPKLLDIAAQAPSQLTNEKLNGVKNLVVLGRGLGYGITKEIALKLKEVASIHAEAFSSAEFLHGPVTLVEQKLTIIDCHVDDESASSHHAQISEVTCRGADVIGLHQVADGVHPRLAPLLVLQRFYLDVAKVAVGRGFNPDQPLGLKKVTRTL